MFDKKAYVKEKIFKKLLQSEIYNSKADEDGVNNLLDICSVDLSPIKGETLEESTLGWKKFCEIIENLISENQDLNYENFKLKYNNYENFKLKYNEFSSEKEKVSPISDLAHIVDENSFQPNKLNLSRVLENAEELDLFEAFDPSYITEHGLRMSGVIDLDSTSLDGEDIIVDQSDNIPVIILNNKEDKIVSPYPGSNEIFQINSYTWLDIDAEKEFKVFYSEDSR